MVYVLFVFLFLAYLVWSYLGPSMLLQMAFFFYDWVELYYTYVPHILYPFIWWLTFRLCLWVGHCRYCCYEHWGECIFLNYSLCGYMSKSGIDRTITIFNFWRNCHTVLYRGCTNLHFHLQCRRVPFYHTLSSICDWPIFKWRSFWLV